MTMTNTVDANKQLSDSLHYHPDAYWCPDCWAFTLDCKHLVPALTTRLVTVIDDWLIRAVRYDRQRRILEVHLHAGGSYQQYGVPVELALMLVKSKTPGEFYRERIGKFPFKRVRVDNSSLPLSP
jgi:hypothetical protein